MSRRPRLVVRTLVQAVGGFYRQPVALVALFVSSVLLSFGGGAVMFWFHAIARGERGPAIDDLHHWLLDSSLGFVALTPALALILPLGVRVVSTDRPSRVHLYVVTVAGLFTLLTGPGPFLHNQLAGPGTPLAQLAIELFGRDAAVVARSAHVHPRSSVTEGLLQLAVGLPVYLLCTWLALRLVRAAVARSRRRPSHAVRSPGPGSDVAGAVVEGLTRA